MKDKRAPGNKTEPAQTNQRRMVNGSIRDWVVTHEVPARASQYTHNTTGDTVPYPSVLYYTVPIGRDDTTGDNSYSNVSVSSMAHKGASARSRRRAARPTHSQLLGGRGTQQALTTAHRSSYERALTRPNLGLPFGLSGPEPPGLEGAKHMTAGSARVSVLDDATTGSGGRPQRGHVLDQRATATAPCEAMESAEVDL